MKDDAAPDQAPTVPAIPLRTRQRHRVRSRKDGRARPLSLTVPHREEVPLESATFATVEEPIEEHFFAAGDSVAPFVHDEPQDLALPLVHAPRRGLAAIVIGAVALAAGLCVAALAPKPVRTPSPVTPVVAPARVVDDIPDPPPPVEAPVAAATATPSPVTAKVLRESARASLVKHELPEAISAAEDATTAAPEEAEGWLLLGAAQLEAGRSTQAKETFRTCTRVAQTGPVGECRSFAHR